MERFIYRYARYSFKMVKKNRNNRTPPNKKLFKCNISHNETLCKLCVSTMW